MSITNYEISKTKVNFSINTHPNLTNQEFNARADKFDKFVVDLCEKFQDDLTNKQINRLRALLKNITIPYEYGYLNFNPEEVLKIDTDHADSMLGTLQAFRDSYQEQKDSLEQQM